MEKVNLLSSYSDLKRDLKTWNLQQVQLLKDLKAKGISVDYGSAFQLFDLYVKTNNKYPTTEEFIDFYEKNKLAASLNKAEILRGFKIIAEFLFEYTLQDLLKDVDPNHLKHKQRTDALSDSVLEKVYASTVQYKTPSSKYSQNGIMHQQKILFQDFVVLAKDKAISIEEAVKYAIEGGDVHVMCSCAAYKYWAYAYMNTQLGTQYGPGENRAPTRNNTELKGILCKHLDKAIHQLYKDESKVIEKFKNIYRDLPEAKKAQKKEENKAVKELNKELEDQLKETNASRKLKRAERLASLI